MTLTARKRDIRHLIVKSAIRSETGTTITTTDGWSFWAKHEHGDQLPAGTAFEQETIGFSKITGLAIDGRWLYRKSDEELEQEHDAMLAGFAARRREQLEQNRDDWARREALLPDWIRARLTTFRAADAAYFELEGWGYELIVAELAVAYAASDLQDDDVVNELAKREGTSGNQHQMAKALASAHLNGQSVAETVSALSPLTGDAFYTGTH